ncbi:MAG: efflux RND transporter permease subunit [Caldilineaceae bacterium]
MVRWLIESSLRLRFVVVIVAVVLLVTGITLLRAMPVDVFPEFNPPLVEVQTEALGLSAEEVEQMITVPMEQDLLNGVPWLREIRSESIPGLSSITLIFDDGVDLIRARQMVTERLAQAFALPHVSKPPTMLQPLSATNRVMMIGLSSQDLSLIDLSVLARWTIAPRLMGVPGVANVAIWGQRDRQLQVQVDPQVLADKKISLLQVLETTGNAMWVSSLSFLEASTPGTGGFIDTPQQRLGIRHILPISSAENLAKVPVEESTLTLGDVATVVEDHQPLIGDAISAAGPGLLLVVEKQPDVNTLAVTRDLDAVLEAMQPGLPGVALDASIFRPASFLELVIANLRWALLLGALLLLLIVAAFFWQWRTALIVLIAVPVALLVAIVLLAWWGVTLNLLLVAGLAVALGIVVDDAITGVEHVVRRLRQTQSEESTLPLPAIILEAALELRRSTIAATLIVLLPLLPILVIGGRSGAFLWPLLLAYSAAVLASLLVALTLTPALSLLLLASPRFAGSGPGALLAPLSRLQRGYERLLTSVIRLPRLVPFAIVIIGLIGLEALPFFERTLLPAFHEPELLIQMDGMPGASNAEMDRVVARVTQELRVIPGVLNLGAHVGRAIMSDQVANFNASEMWVRIDPAADYAATVDAIREVVDGYPGLQSNVQTYLNARSSGLLAPSNEPIGVRLFGEDMALLNSTAEELQKALTGVAGVTEMHIKHPAEEPTLEVQVDLAAAEKYGIKPGDVRRTATTLLSGLQVGSLFEESKVFDVVVLGTPATRRSLSSMNNLLIDTPAGGHVRLGDVAQVRIVPVPNAIRREGVSRYLDIDLTVEGRNLSAVAADIQPLLRQFHYPTEFHAELFGDYAQQAGAQSRLLSVVIAVLIGILLLLQASFGGWRLAIFYWLTLPAALLGGVLAVFLTGGMLSIGALFGFLTVFGITVRNGLQMVDHYRHLQRVEQQPFGPALVVRGAQERLLPILLTACATVLLFLPLVLAGNLPGYEIVRPLAIVVIGGLITATLVNLFVTPALYLHYGLISEKEDIALQLHHEPHLSAAAD